MIFCALKYKGKDYFDIWSVFTGGKIIFPFLLGVWMYILSLLIWNIQFERANGPFCKWPIEASHSNVFVLYKLIQNLKILCPTLIGTGDVREPSYAVIGTNRTAKWHLTIFASIQWTNNCPILQVSIVHPNWKVAWLGKEWSIFHMTKSNPNFQCP